ncbi:MAG: EAL domain-containing protein [Planctomycetota bacterium]
MPPRLRIEELPLPELGLRVLYVGDEVLPSVDEALREDLGMPGTPSVRTLAEARDYVDEQPVDLALVALGEDLEVQLAGLRELLARSPDLGLVLLHDPALGGLDELMKLCSEAAVLSREAACAESLHATIHSVAHRRRARQLEAARNELGEWRPEQLEAIVATTSDGLVVVDAEGRIVFANPGACVMLGVDFHRIEGRKVVLPFDPRFWTEVELDDGKTVEARIDLMEWDDRPAWLLSLREVTDHRATRDELIDLAAELERANNQLAQLAFQDPLTGVLNRRGLEARLVEELHDGPDAGVCLVAVEVDIDDFKRVNDTLGHAVGDKTLRSVAERIGSMLEHDEYLARVGGDEFLVVLPRCSLEHGRHLAERLRLAIRDLPLPLGGAVGVLTASLSVGEVPPFTFSVEDILAETGRALQESKLRGKDRVTAVEDVDSGEVDDTAARVFDVRKELLGRSGIRVLRQRIVHMDDGRTAGFEFLTRGPVGPFEGPLDFFRLAGEQGAQVAVDLRCMDLCLAAVQAVPGYEKYNINLFPSTILAAPIEFLIQRFRQSGNLADFCIEISEQQFLGDPQVLRDPVRSLREAGIRVAIDDVGFARSSLEGLIVLEPDVVKLDRRYVHGVAGHPEIRQCLGRLVAVVRALGAEPVAEGIETREDLQVLLDLGVDLGQGYFWGRPE